MSSLFIFGLGYSARLFAEQALAKGWRVQATVRTKERFMPGVEMHLYDGENPLDLSANPFEGVTHVLHSIPPDREKGDSVFNHHINDLKKIESLEWMGYLSTTGVYGNKDGATVTERSSREPSSKRSKARKIAEDQWLGSGLPAHIFRLAGIYGPTRSIFRQIRSGNVRMIDKPGHVFSRIHRDDIVGVLWASVNKPNPPSAYNVCDNAPTEPAKVTAYACDLLGVEAPKPLPFEEVAKTMSPMALTFWQDNKRVDNSLLKSELGYDLRYPTYKEGLQSILEAESDGI